MDEPRSLECSAFTGGQVHWESRAGLIPLTPGLHRVCDFSKSFSD